jgi:TRAP-type mannitol/chloroaromatic compound transport system substrate-binding protein
MLSHKNTIRALALALAAGLGCAAHAQQAAPAGAKVLKMQSSWPASSAAQDHFKLIAERVDKLTGGQLKIEALAAGQVVPPFEILDAASKKVIDGGHSISYYWVGKNKAAVLFAGPPGGPFGMDHTDYLGWMWEGGGQELWNELYQNVMKLNLVVMPAHPTSPQAFGWFKRPIKSLADFKSMKCRQTGINAEVFTRMGMQTINMPGGEIIPAAQRGVIDCAEWVGGIEDLRLGLHNVWKYHYTPGVHENNTIGEFFINTDVWKALTPVQQEIMRSANRDAFVSWSARYQKQNADALKELQEKHGVRVLRTPPEILSAYLKAWEGLAAEEAGKNPFFKKVWESQRAYASVVVPAKRFMYPPYSYVANYYWPESAGKGAAKGGDKKK